MKLLSKIPQTPIALRIGFVLIGLLFLVVAAQVPSLTQTKASETTQQTLSDTSAPTAPYFINVGASSPTMVAIFWGTATDDSGSIAAYNVYRDSNRIYSGNTTYYYDTGVTGGNTYSYYVTATDPSGNEGPATENKTVTTPPGPTPTNTPIPTLTTAPTPTVALSSPTPTVTTAPTLTPSPTVAVDTSGPTVAITSPANNGTVAKNATTTIQASASDISGVSKVMFYVNNVLTCTDTATPYTCAWMVPNRKGTVYSLKATAYDTLNNTSSSTISVTSK